MALSKGLNKGLIREFYEMGLSSGSIAEAMDCNTSTVLRHLDNMGVPRRSVSEASKTSRPNAGRFSSDKFRHRTKQNGYVYIWRPEHPRAIKHGYVAEHLLVWEESNKQPLPKGYCIHHLNGMKDDNRPENLTAMKIGEHINQTRPYIKRIKELENELSKM